MNISRYPDNVCSELRFVQFTIYSFESVNVEDMPQLSHHMHAMFWMQKGTGSLVIDTEHYDLEDDTIFYIRPGELIKARVDDSAKGFLISFSKQFLNLFENSSSLKSHNLLSDHSLSSRKVHIHKDTSVFLEDLAGKMAVEFAGYDDMRTEIISSLLKIFIIYVTRQCEVVNKDLDQCRKMELASQFFSLLEKNFTDRKLVKDYADMLSVTPGYINKVIKEITRFSASYHIQQRIILEAKRRILSGGNNLKEIAYTLGFCDPAHFSKFFKSGAGTNFTNFKKSALGYSHFF